MITKNGCFYGGDGPYESQTAGVLYNESQFSRHIYFLEKMYLEMGQSICFSKFFSHSEQCALYYIQRTQM